MGEPAFQLPDEDKPDIRPNLRALEGGSKPTPRKYGHLSMATSDDDTANKGGDRSEPAYGNSVLDDVKEKLGKGYSEGGGSSKSYKGSSRLKKRAGIVAAVTGGGIIAAIIAFLALLPLKLEHMVTNLENRFGAASSQALNRETTNLLKGYITKYIIPSITSKRCHNTVDASCVVTVAGDGPITQTYKAWKNDRFEKKLADFGLSMGRSGQTYYINTGGQKVDFSSPEKMAAFINDPGSRQGKKVDIERQLSKFLKDQTRWQRVYYRFRLAPFLKEKNGIRHCINSCSKVNEFKDNIAIKKQAAKAYVLERVLSPLSENYSFILQCILAGTVGCNVNTLRNASPGDTTLSTEADQGLRDNLRRAAARFATDDGRLERLVAKSRQLEKDGVSKYLVRNIVSKIAESAGKDGVKAGASAAKAVDPITWLLLAEQLATTARQIGPVIKYAGYIANSAAAAQLFSAYQTVASETKSGQIDLAQLGSFNNGLDTSLDTSDLSSMKSAASTLKDSGSDVTPSSATQTPLYQSIMGTAVPSTSTTASQISAALSGTAYAATQNSSGDGYICDNGKPVQSGEIVCEEEKLDRGKTTARVIESMSKLYDGYLNVVPGMNTLLSIIHAANSVINKGLGWAIDKVAPLFSKLLKVYCLNPLSGCSQVKSAINTVGPFMLKQITNILFNSPFNNLSGGRVFDMLAAGASVSFNQSAQENLGASSVSDTTAGKVQTAYLNEQQEEFRQQPLFARIFNTTTPYSLISKVALSLPSSASSASSSLFVNLEQNPFNILGQLFASMLAPRGVSAYSGAAVANPFGVPQAAYSSSQIPADPETFWNNNCVNGPEGVWHEDQPVGKQLDISEWLNKGQDNKAPANLLSGFYDQTREQTIVQAHREGKNVTQDPSSGQAIYVNPNRCLLIQASFQSAGGLADPSLLPAVNPGGGSALKVATYNVLGANHTTGTSYQGRADKFIQVITSNNIDVIGLQELQGRQRDYIYPKIKNFYDVFPAAKDASSAHSAENSIMWNKTKYQIVGQGKFQPGLVYFCSKKLNAPYVKLKDTASGQEFYVLNTHDPANSVNNPCINVAERDRYRNALQHLEFMKSLESEGLPIIYTGDFNSKYILTTSGKNGNPYLGKAKNLTYCILTSDGSFNDAYDVYSKRAAQCPTTTPPGSGAGIDHVYLSKDIGVTGYQSIPGGANGTGLSGSDHPALIFDVVLPKSDSGSTVTEEQKNGWVWPIAKKDYKTLSQCFKKPGHTGIDIPVGVGTNIYAAHSGVVTQTDPSGSYDGGKFIIIKHDNGLWSNYQHNSALLVKKGDSVTAGQLIAKSGNTGYSFGPHSHFSITNQPGLDSRNTVLYSLDPLPFLPTVTGRNLGGCK